MFEKKTIFRKNDIFFLSMQMENFKQNSKGEKLYFRAVEADFPFSEKSWNF